MQIVLEQNNDTTHIQNGSFPVVTKYHISSCLA